jgi:hypothetical protein
VHKRQTILAFANRARPYRKYDDDDSQYQRYLQRKKPLKGEARLPLDGYLKREIDEILGITRVFVTANPTGCCSEAACMAWLRGRKSSN